MQSYQKLILQNKAWALDTREYDEEYFDRLATDQHPQFLWIGCADSRVPAEKVTDTDPGEIFVHRNIANLVVPNDLNVNSVVQYAVEVLKVKHVIVCGHYGCGGVKASMGDAKLGLIDNWLLHIKQVKEDNREELAALPDEQARFNRLVELNTIVQVKNLANNDSIKKMWAEGNQPVLHGWAFDLRTGLLNQLIQVMPNGDPAENLPRWVKMPEPV